MKRVIQFSCVVILLLFLFSCKQTKEREKEKTKNNDISIVEKYNLTFSHIGQGSLKVFIGEEKAKEIDSPCEVEKDKIVIFEAEASPYWQVKGWEGIEVEPKNAKTVQFRMSKDENIKVIFEETIPPNFVLVDSLNADIVGKNITYKLPDEGESWKGVFIEGRTLKISPYFICKYEVSYKLWKEVVEWAATRGYTFKNLGVKGANHGTYKEEEHTNEEPCTQISWYDCVVWCNAYTEKEMGSEYCVYRVSAKDSTILRDSSKKDMFNKIFADIAKKGFRLPTDAEWELAARWQGEDNTNAEKYGNIYLTKLNSISGAKKCVGFDELELPEGETWISLRDEAVRVAVFDEWWDGLMGTDLEPPTKKTENVGSKEPNALGIFDMGGNVYEWCFDWYDDSVEKGIFTNPQGKENGTLKVTRGGSWISDAWDLSLGNRAGIPPQGGNNRTGFRLAATK